MAPHVGIIITVSVLVAAGIAAYENPQVREWVERSREKIAVALHSLGDDIQPKSPRRDRDDLSMREEQGERAAERRRVMREEIMEKGRQMEELRRRQRRNASGDSVELNEKRTPSFDSLVDEQGHLRPRASETQTHAESTAVEAEDMMGTLRSRQPLQYQSSQHHQQIPEEQPLLQMPMHESVDAPMLLRQFEGTTGRVSEPWESQYEREMRNEWSITLPQHFVVPSSHASESLIDLTPTTENVPDPEVLIPTGSDAGNSINRTEYFSSARSRSSHTMSEAGESDYYYAHPNQPLTPIEPRPMEDDTTTFVLGSSAVSVAGSEVPVQMSDLDSEDDFSELGDGVRTPGSVWTDVDSTVSGDR